MADRGRKAFKVSSHICFERENDINYKKHINRLQNMGASVDNTPPQTMHLINKQNPKKEQQLRERLYEIQLENGILLDKMLKIANYDRRKCSRPFHGRTSLKHKQGYTFDAGCSQLITDTGGQTHNPNKYEGPKSAYNKQQELLHLAHENQKILKAINSQQAVYKVNDLDRGFVEHCLTSERISTFRGDSTAKFHSPGIVKLNDKLLGEELNMSMSLSRTQKLHELVKLKGLDEAPSAPRTCRYQPDKYSKGLQYLSTLSQTSRPASSQSPTKINSLKKSQRPQTAPTNPNKKQYESMMYNTFNIQPPPKPISKTKKKKTSKPKQQARAELGMGDASMGIIDERDTQDHELDTFDARLMMNESARSNAQYLEKLDMVNNQIMHQSNDIKGKGFGGFDHGMLSGSHAPPLRHGQKHNSRGSAGDRGRAGEHGPPARDPPVIAALTDENIKASMRQFREQQSAINIQDVQGAVQSASPRVASADEVEQDLAAADEVAQDLAASEGEAYADDFDGDDEHAQHAEHAAGTGVVSGGYNTVGSQGSGEERGGGGGGSGQSDDGEVSVQESGDDPVSLYTDDAFEDDNDDGGDGEGRADRSLDEASDGVDLEDEYSFVGSMPDDLDLQESASVGDLDLQGAVSAGDDLTQAASPTCGALDNETSQVLQCSDQQYNDQSENDLDGVRHSEAGSLGQRDVDGLREVVDPEQRGSVERPGQVGAASNNGEQYNDEVDMVHSAEGALNKQATERSSQGEGVQGQVVYMGDDGVQQQEQLSNGSGDENESESSSSHLSIDAGQYEDGQYEDGEELEGGYAFQHLDMIGGLETIPEVQSAHFGDNQAQLGKYRNSQNNGLDEEYSDEEVDAPSLQHELYDNFSKSELSLESSGQSIPGNDVDNVIDGIMNDMSD